MGYITNPHIRLIMLSDHMTAQFSVYSEWLGHSLLSDLSLHCSLERWAGEGVGTALSHTLSRSQISIRQLGKSQVHFLEPEVAL